MASRRYRVVVDGELSDHLEPAFEGMTLSRREGRTVLEGELRDQAELQGLFRRVAALGLTLLEVKAVEPMRGESRVAPAR